MTNSINGIGSFPTVPPEPARGASASHATPTDSTFHQRLLESLGGANDTQPAAQTAGDTLPAGIDFEQVQLLSTEKQAELSLQIMLQLRQQLHEAYQEIKDLRSSRDAPLPR